MWRSVRVEECRCGVQECWSVGEEKCRCIGV